MSKETSVSMLHPYWKVVDGNAFNEVLKTNLLVLEDCLFSLLAGGEALSIERTLVAKHMAQSLSEIRTIQGAFDRHLKAADKVWNSCDESIF